MQYFVDNEGFDVMAAYQLIEQTCDLLLLPWNLRECVLRITVIILLVQPPWLGDKQQGGSIDNI